MKALSHLPLHLRFFFTVSHLFRQMDFNATVGHSEGSAFPPIVLCDDVPGGAGLVARLENENVLRDALTVALDRVDGKCGCAENTSCYGCLRSYRNQFVHDILQRGLVKCYLEDILERWH